MTLSVDHAYSGLVTCVHQKRLILVERIPWNLFVCVASYCLHYVVIIRVSIEIIVGCHSLSYILLTKFDQKYQPYAKRCSSLTKYISRIAMYATC